jgi:hypothetical protein
MPLMRIEKSPYSQLRGSKLRFKKGLLDETEEPGRTKAQRIHLNNKTSTMNISDRTINSNICMIAIIYHNQPAAFISSPEWM